MPRHPPAIPLKTAKNHQVRVKRTSTSDFEPRWTIFQCLVWEGDVAGHRYALFDQRWFKIDDDFYKQLQHDLSQLPSFSVALPNSTITESEEDYNMRAARNGPFALLDQKCISVTGAGSSIEICDLLSASGCFIHVKRKTRSATLSHLFSQGTTAAELFLRSGDFRRQARLKLRRQPRFSGQFTDGRPDPSKFEIAYAVIAKAGPRRALPFFSRVNLRQAAERLSTFGYKVSFGFIDC